MPNKSSSKQSPYDCPANYRIVIKGSVDPSWSKRLACLTVQDKSFESGLQITTLEGVMSDQAALAGVLDALYELHLPILVVMRLDIE